MNQAEHYLALRPSPNGRWNISLFLAGNQRPMKALAYSRLVFAEKR
jgi:hypothetical protein